jgi:hypothetical protein
MPKNPSTKILERWQAMDADLGSLEGLHVPSFARRWYVSTKTVHRDLAAFRALGQSVVCELYEGGRRYVWHYEGGVQWLFLSNLPQGVRRELEAARKKPRPPR